MPKPFVLVAGGSPALWPEDLLMRKDDFRFVGVDRGALYLLERGIEPFMAVGDFDSITLGELKQIENHIQLIFRSQAEKDDTDTELALLKITELAEGANIILIGATGGRLDHFLSNFWLPLQSRFQPFTRQIKLLDRQNTITYYLPGVHEIVKERDKKYIAFLPLTPVAGLTLAGVKYPLEEVNVPGPFSYASNEFLASCATLSFTSGMVAVIQSCDK